MEGLVAMKDTLRPRVIRYRGTSLEGKRPPPRTTIGPWA